MTAPLVYLALAPELVGELTLDDELPRLAGLAQIEAWPGPGRPTPAARGATLLPLPELLAHSDIVALHAPVTAAGPLHDR